MPDVPVIDPSGVAAHFFLVQELLAAESGDPLRKWLEYQAYVELIQFLAAQDALPQGYELEALDLQRIRDWIRGRRDLPANLVEQIRKIFLALQATGGDIFDKFCNFYCAYKNKMDAGFTAASVAWTVPELAKLLVEYKFDVLLFYGLPITTLASLLIKFDVLDTICDCESR